jgi:copper chaperone
MQSEQFQVKNVKCGGCVSTIREGLLGMSGVKAVEVTIDGGRVKVEGEGLDRAALAQKLGQLGYPVA